MKSIVVIAYYHLMHAIGLALSFDEKPNLYVCVDYTRMDDEIVENIRRSGVFNEVVKTNSRDFLDDFTRELRQTKKASEAEIREIGTGLFDEYVDAYYYPLFKGADFDEDIYIYSEYHLIFYSINKHFKSIILCEDGYKVMNSRLASFSYRGYFKQLVPFIEAGYYPKMMFQSEKITKLICSGDYEGLPDELRKKVEVLDFKELVKPNTAAYKKALQVIFPTDDISIRDGSVLLIEQPLYRTKFCSNLKYYLFYRKLVRELSRDRQVIIKQHPAGTKQMGVFKNDNVEIIQKWIPVECLNYLDVTFDSVVTFYSAALELMENTKSHKVLYDREVIDEKGIRSFIEEYTEGEAIHIGLYIYYTGFHKKILKELKEYYKSNKSYKIHVILVCPEDQTAEARELAGKLQGKAHETIEVIASDEFDQNMLLRTLIENGSKYDYSMAISGHSKSRDVKRTIRKICKGRMELCIGIHQLCNRYTVIGNPLYDHVLTGVVNVLWNTNVLKQFEQNNITEMTDALQYVYENKIPTEAIPNEAIISFKACREDMKNAAVQCSNKELREILLAYNTFLEYIYEESAEGETLSYDLPVFFRENGIEQTELLLNVLLYAYRIDDQLRRSFTARTWQMENRRSVSLLLKLLGFRKMIKRKIRAFLKKIGMKKEK